MTLFDPVEIFLLASAGSPTDPDDPRAVNGRRPVSVVPEE